MEKVNLKRWLVLGRLFAASTARILVVFDPAITIFHDHRAIRMLVNAFRRCFIRFWNCEKFIDSLTTFVRNTHKRSNLLFGGLIDDVGSFLHGSRLHCCWSLGFPASSQFELLTPSRIQRTSLVCTPVPHVTEHWKNRLGIYNEIYIGIYISGSRKVTVLVRP